MLRCEIYSSAVPDADAPLVVVPCFGGEGTQVWAELAKPGFARPVLAAVQVDDWEETLSPWPGKSPFRGGRDFGAGADAFVDRLVDELLPDVRRRAGLQNGRAYIAGYSFAGLFALYSLYKTDAFDGAVCASGSLWYPGFMEYAESHALCGTPERLYFSLGDAESRTRNPVMRTVGERTEALVSHYRALGVDCVWELNPGNHFAEPDARLAKGILRLLDRQISG